MVPSKSNSFSLRSKGRDKLDRLQNRNKAKSSQHAFISSLLEAAYCLLVDTSEAIIYYKLRLTPRLQDWNTIHSLPFPLDAFYHYQHIPYNANSDQLISLAPSL